MTPLLIAAPAAKLLSPSTRSPRPTFRRRRIAPAVPCLSVVLVNYHSWADTARLVRRLRTSSSLRAGAAEVMIVDNHSPAHPVLGRLRCLEGVSLRRWGRNRGFARAVNEGVRLSQGRWVLLLNPDMTVPPGFLDSVLAVADRLDREQPRTGIVGFGLRNTDGSRQPSTGPLPTLLGSLARLLVPRPWRKYHLLPPPAGAAVPWATGCCLLVRREVLEDVGGLDPEFFLYYEDVDLCRRARAHGWEIRYEPGLQAVHHHPLHLRPVQPHVRLLTRHGLLTYARKHWPRWQLRLLARIVQAEAWLKRRIAVRRRDPFATETFEQLAQLAEEMRTGRFNAARCRVASFIERCEREQKTGRDCA